MTDTSAPVDIPDRPLFKAAEVCELAKIQPYVLRSWEAEFKDLGVAKSGSSTRVYRRGDVERVLRIRHLLLIEGLTLAGVRRRLEQEAEPPLEEQVPEAVQAPMASATRARIGDVKRGLRSLLDLLDAPIAEPSAGAGPGLSESVAEPVAEFVLAPLPDGDSGSAKSAKRTAAGNDGVKSSSPRRKRSA